jgi:hypothetical protein
MTYSFIILARSFSEHRTLLFPLARYPSQRSVFRFSQRHSVHEYTYQEHNDLSAADGKSERSHSQQIHADHEEVLLREIEYIEEYRGVVSLNSFSWNGKRINAYHRNDFRT